MALILIFFSATSYSDEEPLEVVVLSVVEVNALSGPINLEPILMKSKTGRLIYGEAGIRPIDSRMIVKLKKLSCGSGSQPIAGHIVDKDEHEGLRIKCIDIYASQRGENTICMVGQVEAGRMASALIR